MKSEILRAQNISCVQSEKWHHGTPSAALVLTIIRNPSSFHEIWIVCWMGLTFSILFQHLGGVGGQRLTCPFGDKGPLVIGGKSVCKARVTISHSDYWSNETFILASSQAFVWLLSCKDVLTQVEDWWLVIPCVRTDRWVGGEGKDLLWAWDDLGQGLFFTWAGLGYI